MELKAVIPFNHLAVRLKTMEMFVEQEKQEDVVTGSAKLLKPMLLVELVKHLLAMDATV